MPTNRKVPTRMRQREEIRQRIADSVLDEMLRTGKYLGAQEQQDRIQAEMERQALDDPMGPLPGNRFGPPPFTERGLAIRTTRQPTTIRTELGFHHQFGPKQSVPALLASGIVNPGTGVGSQTRAQQDALISLIPSGNPPPMQQPQTSEAYSARLRSVGAGGNPFLPEIAPGGSGPVPAPQPFAVPKTGGETSSRLQAALQSDPQLAGMFDRISATNPAAAQQVLALIEGTPSVYTQAEQDQMMQVQGMGQNALRYLGNTGTVAYPQTDVLQGGIDTLGVRR
jgi:truncated hemoglobin YjbI